MRRSVAAVALATTVLCAACEDGPAPAVPSPPAPADWSAGRSTPVADTLYPEHGNAGLDVLRYDLRLDWKPDQKLLSGTATLRIRPTAAAEEITLDFANLSVDSVTVDDRPATGTLAEQKLTVPARLTADRQVTLVVAYHGTPEQVTYPSRRGDAAEGVGLRPAADGGLWTMQEPWGAMTWYPANELVSDKALYDIRVTVPPGWTAVASGTPAAEEGRFTSAVPVAAYLTTLAVDRYTRVTQAGPHGVQLNYWILPKADDRLLPSLRKSPEILTWLESMLGPYPFETGGALLNGSVSAMETQQMLSIGRSIGEDRAYFEEVLVHEYAHQWFGDAVTPSTWTDLWLNEGFAQYLQYLWQQRIKKFSDADLERFLRRRDAELRSSVGPPGRPKAANFAESNIYVCGAAMLKELNDALGDRRFFALLTAWITEHRNTNQDRASFTAFVRKNTGTDFSKMIDTWLDATSTPE